MKANPLLFGVLLFFLTFSLTAQVGVGNTNPQSSLDISASNTANPANTDGILIPRIDNFPAANPTASQDGMLVFYTGTGFSGKGFYYWNQSITNWVYLNGSDDQILSIAGTQITIENGNSITLPYVNQSCPAGQIMRGFDAAGNIICVPDSSGSDADWYQEGTSTAPVVNTADIFTLGDVTIGSNVANTVGTLFVSSGDKPSGINLSRYVSNTTASAYGGINSFTNLLNGSSGQYYNVGSTLQSTVDVTGAMYNYRAVNNVRALSTSGSRHYLFYGLFSNNIGGNSSAERYGSYIEFTTNTTSQGDKYGHYNSIPASLSGTHYGMYSNVQNTSGYAAYFIGRTSLGATTTNRYLMPDADGTANQVMVTDGAGQINFADVNSLVTVNNNTLDQAYDEGGPGAGRIITADNGAVAIEGDGGLRVESNSETHMLFVDGANNTIGIGQNNPQNPLHIGMTTVFDLDHANIGQDGLFIKGGGDDTGLNAIGGSIGFGPPSTVRSDQRKAAIAAVQTATDIDLLGLAFYTHGNTINQSPMRESMRLNHNGFLGINNNDPSATLDVIGTMQFVDGNENNGYILSSDANGNASWTDPSTIFTDTDDQTIDNFSFNTSTNILSLEIENDGVAAQTVDLSSLVQSDEIDWYEANTTNKPDAITDDIYTQGHVAIGKSTANYPLDVFENTNGTLYGIYIDKSDNTTNETSGLFIRKTGSGTGRNHGVFTDVDGTGTGQKYGIFNRISSSANGNQYGTRNYINGATSSFQFGVFNNLDNNGTGNEYGVYNGMRTPNANNVYGVYNEFQQPTTANETTGIRNTFTNGTPGSDGMNGTYTSFNNSANGNYYGSRNIFLAGATGTGNKFGSYNEIAAAAGGTHYGTYNSVSTTNGWAGYFLGRVYVGTNATNGYDLPTTDGANGQVLVTNGAGTVSFGTITGESSSASNGLTEVGNDIRWGGTLTQDTSINYGAFDTRFNLNGTGDFIVQDAGVGKFTVLDNGDAVFGGDLYWRDENTGGTLLGRFIDDGNDGRLQIYENGNVSIDLDANSESVFNQQGLDRDFRIESNGSANMFMLDAGLNRIGINTGTPDGMLDIETNSTGTVVQLELTENQANDGGRIKFNNSVEATNHWTLYGRADNTLADNRFNLYHSSAGNVIVATGNGRVGIMRAPATNTLEVNGNASKNTAGNWLANSDRRLKTNIQTISGDTALEKLLRLRGVSYEWNDTKTGTKRPDNIQYGFIAQELMEVFPEKVTVDALGYYQTAYGDYDAFFVQAIKELHHKVETLEAENTALKAQLDKIAALEARLTALENNNNTNSKILEETAESAKE